MILKSKGVIHDIKDTQVITDKFSKRELILEIPDDKYPQFCSFEFSQKSCATLDNFSIGQEVEITFSLKGREYKGKYYNSLNSFDITLIGTKSSMKEVKKEVDKYTENNDNDLPF